MSTKIKKSILSRIQKEKRQAESYLNKPVPRSEFIIVVQLNQRCIDILTAAISKIDPKVIPEIIDEMNKVAGFKANTTDNTVSAQHLSDMRKIVSNSLGINL